MTQTHKDSLPMKMAVSPEYTSSFSVLITQTSIQEDYFGKCQYDLKIKEQCGNDDANKKQLVYNQEVAISNNPAIHKTKENDDPDERTLQDQDDDEDEEDDDDQEEEGSSLVSCESEEEEEIEVNQQLPNTDEDTKSSEQDSPLITNKTNIQDAEAMQHTEEEKKHSFEYDSLVKQTQSRTGKISKDDFALIQVIGTGSYGKVLLVKKRGTERYYAMKILKKKHIRQKKQVRNTWTERKVLEKVSHPFIVKMNYAFQNEKKLFFVLDYCPGGELFFYIQHIGRFKESSAKFYAANVLLALECLHENGIVYRDLKPENILIDSDGYAKLTDFGLSKDNIKGDNLANSFCGTCEYLAPEVLNKHAYGKSCDWWSFGCVLYEMLTAQPPFYAKKRDDLFNSIKFKNPNFYNYHSKDAVDLISQLLRKNPSDRLGSQQGFNEIKNHPFFADIDWERMMKKKLTTPYTPQLDTFDDTKHFDQEICNIPIESPPQDQSDGGHCKNSYVEESNDDFLNFTFEPQNVLSHEDSSLNYQ